MKKILTVLLFIFSFLSSGVKGQFYDIKTVAGNGIAGYNGNGIAATSAKLDYPSGVVVDGSGNMYIADYDNNRIRKVANSGTISIFAGNGTFGYGGDGGSAISAHISRPVGVALDDSGNLYIADYGNNCIRKVNTSGIISTIAGNDTAGYSGDGGQATLAELKYPLGVTVDGSGNIYIADGLGNRIRKVNTHGIISTIAGNGTSGYSGDGVQATSTELNDPYGVAVDDSGNVYIADDGNNRIRKVNTHGIISTIAGNGTAGYLGDGLAATGSELNQPQGVILDASGNLYITDHSNNCIRKVNTSGIISTIAGNGTRGYFGDGGIATSAELANPAGAIAFDISGNMYFADQGNQRIRKLTISGAGVNDLGIENGSVIVYPNPNNGVFTIYMKGQEPKDESEVQVYNILGEKVFSQYVLLNAAYTINIGTQPKGIYLYRVLTKEGTLISNGKFAIE